MKTKIKNKKPRKFKVFSTKQERKENGDSFLRRIVDKKETFIFLVGLISVIVFAMIYIFYFQPPLAPPPQEEEEDQFPEDFYSYITSIDITKGNIVSGDKDDLKADDNEYLVINGGDFDIVFNYDVNLEKYPLDYYDIYFNLDIDNVGGGDIVEFQIYKDYAWEKLADISSSPIHLERQYLDRTIKFRLYGDPSGTRTFSFDRMNLILTHSGKDNGFTWIEGEMLFWTITDVRHIGFTTEAYSSDITLERPYWYEGNLPFYQRSEGIGSADTSVDITMEIGGMDGTVTEYTEFNDLTIGVHWSHADKGTHYLRGYLWNYDTNSWDSNSKIQINDQSELKSNTFNWADKYSNVLEHTEDYINNNFEWRFKIESHIEDGSPLTLYTQVELIDSEIEFKGVGYGFDKIDYNDIDVWLEPFSPIDKPYEFIIYANITQHLVYDSNFKPFETIDPEYNIIDMETGWERGWKDMNLDSGTTWMKEFDDIDFDVGKYTIWVRCGLKTDNDDFISYKAIEVEFRSRTTNIEFINPTPYSTITQLSNYDITVFVDTEDWYDIDGVKLKLYDDSHTYIDWQDMTDVGSDYFEYTIDPKDYPNGLYHIQANATDGVDWIVKDTAFYIHNDRPNIEWLNSTEFYESRFAYVSITDPESDTITDAQIKIYSNNPSVPEQDWDNMSLESGNLWKYWILLGNTPESFDNGLYTFLINATDGKGYSQISKFCLLQKEGANITVVEPIFANLSLPLTQRLLVNISTLGDLETTPQWDYVDVSLYDTSYISYNWKTMTNITEFGEDNFTLWEDYFDLDTIRYGDYYFIINITDAYSGTSYKQKQYEIHPFLSYVYSSNDVSYQDSGIIVSYDYQETTELVGSIEIHHSSVVEEREWEVNISADFDDAHNYHIYRGTDDYTPTNVLFNDVETLHTVWDVDYYRDTDIMNFDLDSPYFLYDFQDSTDYETIFTLNSKHSFTDMILSYKMAGTWQSPEYYNFTLYYQYEGKWVEIDEDLYEVKVKSTTVYFELEWDGIDAGDVVRFMFEAIERTDIVATNIAPFLWMGLGGGGSAFVWIFFTNYAIRPSLPRRMGKRNYWILTIALIIGLVVAFYFVGALT